MRVVDPEGVTWEVTRRWLEVPRWRVRRARLEDLTHVDVGFDADLLGIAIGLVLLLLLFALLLIGLPVLVFLAALLVAVGGLVFRVVFGRPWVVEARSERGELQWRVRGTRRSRRAMQEIAAALARGERRFSPRGAQRVLPESPISTAEGSRSVRVLERGE